MLAVTLHNIPEGMAVGVVYAGYLYGQSNITAASAMALSFGIAIQNFPEGAIISMPLRAGGMKRGKSFLFGVLSGAAEPIGAVLTIAASGFFVPLMPYMLSFAAGAMIYVVIEELIPEMSEGKHSNAGTIAFSLGFIAMMILDTVFNKFRKRDIVFSEHVFQKTHSLYSPSKKKVLRFLASRRKTENFFSFNLYIRNVQGSTDYAFQSPRCIGIPSASRRFKFSSTLRESAFSINAFLAF